MSRELKIVIPDEALTVGDIVGRAVRITRLNWLPLLKFFLIPTFINDFASTIMTWEPETIDPSVSPSVTYWIVIASFVVLFWTTWELGIRRFALLVFIADGTIGLEEALQFARRRMWLILVLSIPVVIAEICTGGFFLLFQMVVNAMPHTDLPEPIHVYITFFMLFLILVLMLPTLSVWIINTFFLSIVAFESTNIKSTIARFFRLVFPTFRAFFSYTTLMACAYVAVFFPTIITATFSFFLPHSIASSIVEYTLASIFETPIYSFLTAAITIGGACFYKQMRAKLEGQDILDKLKVLNAS